MLQEKIVELKKSVIEMANLVESMIDNSVQGLLTKDPERIRLVHEYEEKVNRKEIEIEENCITLIALHQPEAKNLRTLIMILKINTDLERMGDLTVNIAQSADYLIKRPFIKKLINIPTMAEETRKMVQQTIQAFLSEDVEMARQVCINDDVVDELKEQTYRLLITYMIDDPATIKRAIHINKVASNLERIADLSTNIAEDSIFISEGRVIKHHQEEIDNQA